METTPLIDQCEAFWQEIRNDSPNSFKQLPTEDQLRLIKKEVDDADVGWDQQDSSQQQQSQDSNALIFAIRIGSFKFVDCILQVLKKSDNESGSDIVLSKDIQGANCLQLFLSQMAQIPNKDKNKNKPPITYKLKESILNGLLSFNSNFKLITNRDQSMQSAILQTVTCESQEFVAKWTSNLLEKLESDADKLAAIQDLEECYCDATPDHTTHAEYCRVGWNLLMLAQKNKHKSPSNCIVEVLKSLQSTSKPEKSLISLGRKKPKFEQVIAPNSICIAAKNGDWDAMRTLLGFVNDEKEQLQALLECSGQEYLSALHWVLQADALHELKPILDAPYRLEEWSRMLKRNVYWRKRFAYLEMSVNSIKMLENLNDAEYLIPKPSRDEKLSRPLAMIFYNSFENTDSPLERAAEEAKNLEEAFQNLGWSKDSIKKIGPRWSTDELARMLKDQLQQEKEANRCSLFILCISTHGESGQFGGLDKDLKKDSIRIESIFELIKDLPGDIPKVIIIDACRYRCTKKIRQELTMENTVLLQGTIDGEGAREDLYLKFLAKNIHRGNMTVNKMHKIAKKAIKTYQENLKAKIAPASAPQMKSMISQRNAMNVDSENSNSLSEEDFLKKLVEDYDTDEYSSDEDDDDEESSCESESCDEDVVTEQWLQDGAPKEKRWKSSPGLSQDKKKTQKPILEEITHKAIVLRRYHDENCRKCEKPVLTESEDFVVCEKCFGSFHFECVKLTASATTRAILDNPYIQIKCEYCMY